jgi:FtsP/CotA-like multicopper oxidase with cupredoxin domain
MLTREILTLLSLFLSTSCLYFLSILLQTKFYHYPNNRPVTSWYHDHALHNTAMNAYYGAAGMYEVSSKKSDGGCGEPWNLDEMEELEMLIADKSLDKNCQLYLDKSESGPHHKDFYGDINLVNGIPWPVMKLRAKWYRFRIINVSLSRPYMLQIVDFKNTVVSANLNCQVIAGDGGFRTAPVAFPREGLIIGVAERYEVVCDLRTFTGKTLYFVNKAEEKIFKGVPYFCYSHLVARIDIGTVDKNAAVFNVNAGTPIAQVDAPTRKVLSPADIDIATKRALAGDADRVFEFGRRHGRWVINGETWDSATIAASDIGSNTHELWHFKTGGGWFHIIHVHLVDLYLIVRNGSSNVRTYEKLTPKDAVFQGPGDDVYVIARFGPHKGDYMFHCHNLIHEDDDMMRAIHVGDTEMGKTYSATNGQAYLTPFNGIIYDNYQLGDPMGTVYNAKPNAQSALYNSAYLKSTLDTNYYRIFFPTDADRLTYGTNYNPWESHWTPGHCA